MSFTIKELNFSKLKSLALDYMVLSARLCVTTCPVLLKILHRTLFWFITTGVASALQTIEQECRLLNTIQHPHIVHYLGTYHDPESKVLVLLMELMVRA